MEIITKFIAAFAGIFALYKILVDVILARFQKRKEEYDFTKKFIEDFNNTDIHNFIKEKGFLTLTGGIFSVQEIKYILELSSPIKALDSFPISGKLLVFDQAKEKYIWSKPYSCKKYRKCARFLYIVLYVFFAFLAFYPITKNGMEAFSKIQNIIFIFGAFVIAITFLIKHERFKEASVFMNLTKEK